MKPSDPILTIRIAVLPYWVVTYILSALLFTVRIVGERHFHLKIYLACLVLQALLILAAVGIMRWLMVVRLMSAEIRGLNSFGIPTTIRWNEIIDLKPFNFVGLKYVRIYSEQSVWPLWFPLQISDKSVAHAKMQQINEKAAQVAAFLDKA